MNEEPTSAVLILANGRRLLQDGNSIPKIIHFPAPFKSMRVAGYILNPSQKTIEESRKL